MGGRRWAPDGRAGARVVRILEGGQRSIEQGGALIDSTAQCPRSPVDRGAHPERTRRAAASRGARRAPGTGREDVRLRQSLRLPIGDETRIGTFVEIQKGAVIGARCKIQSHTFICDGVTIEDEVFVGHGVMFINDTYPRATAAGALQTEADWAARADAGRSGRLDRHRGHDSGRGDDRRRRDGRRGLRRDPGRPARAIVAGNPARVLRTLPDAARWLPARTATLAVAAASLIVAAFVTGSLIRRTVAIPGPIRSTHPGR